VLEGGGGRAQGHRGRHLLAELERADELRQMSR
jgi:hypothetical protein